MGSDTDDKVSTEAQGKFDRPDGSTRDAMLRRRSGTKRASEVSAEAAQALETGAPRAGSTQAGQRPTMGQRVEAEMQYLAPQVAQGFTDAQTRSATARAVKILAAVLDDVAAELVADTWVCGALSIAADYERELVEARRTGAPGSVEPVFADVETTQRLAEFLKGEVAACRKKLFGSTDVPFKSLVEASAWCAKESHENDLALEWPGYEELQEGLRRLGEPGLPFRVSVEERYVLLREPPEDVPPGLPEDEPGTLAELAPIVDRVSQPEYFFLAGRSEHLGHLSDVQRRLAQQVGVAEWQVTRFVLQGVPPSVRRWRAKAPPIGLVLGDNLPPWFDVEIRDRWLSYRDVRNLFAGLVSDGLLMSEEARQRAKRANLYKFCTERRELRTVPMAWDDVTAEWNRAYPKPEDHYTVTAIQCAYRNALVDRGEAKTVRRRAPKRHRGQP